MKDPSSLYWFEDTMRIADMRASVLMVSLSGFLDAGHAGRLLTEHLLRSLDHTVVATFDVDELVDYRGRRPVMTFDSNTWEDYEAPQLMLYRVLDDEGTPFLLLTGQEPDYQWERVVAAIRQLQRILRVELTITAHGIPMAVPHTRPVGVTRHATVEALRTDPVSLFGKAKVPGSLEGLLHVRMKDDDAAAVGFAVHVPHYLIQADYAAGAVAACDAVAEVSGLKLPDTALRLAAAENIKAIEGEVLDSDEARQLITLLEEQYDRLQERKDQLALISSSDVHVPTADEIGAQFEQFLMQYSQEQPPDSSPRGATSTDQS